MEDWINGLMDYGLKASIHPPKPSLFPSFHLSNHPLIQSSNPYAKI
jgi:hypothetical protein